MKQSSNSNKVLRLIPGVDSLKRRFADYPVPIIGYKMTVPINAVDSVTLAGMPRLKETVLQSINKRKGALRRLRSRG